MPPPTADPPAGDTVSKANANEEPLHPIPDPLEGGAGAGRGRQLQGGRSRRIDHRGRGKSLGQAEADRGGGRRPGLPLFRRTVQAGGSSICRRQSVVGGDSFRSPLPRRRRSQATRSGRDSSRAGLQRNGRSPRLVLSRAGSSVLAGGGHRAGQGLDESGPDHSRTDLRRTVRAPRRDDHREPLRPEPPRSGTGA